MEELTIVTDLYANGRIGIRLIQDDGQQYDVLTTNIVAVELEDDQVTIPVWKLSESLVAYYLHSGLFVETGLGVDLGYVVAPIWRVVCPKILGRAAELRKASADR